MNSSKNNWREEWWREMTRSSGAISAMLWDLSPRELKSVADWANYLLKVKEYKKRWSGEGDAN